MPKPARLALTTHADVVWYGELPDDFRARADDILSTRLSDEAWRGLQRCVRSYSIALNHEYTAAPVADQIRAISKVAKLAHELKEAIEAADSPANGNVVSFQVSEAWIEGYDEAAEFDRGLNVMASDLMQVMSEDEAWGLIRGWQSAGRFWRPEPVPDFLLGLEHFTAASRYVAKRLKKGDGPTAREGDAFQGFVGLLYEWKKTFRISAGVSRNTASDGGALTQLVKAIIEQVPEVRDNEGNRERKQMRRAPVADTSLAEAIENARDAYEAARP